MKHKKTKSSLHLFQSRLDQIIDMHHPMVKLSREIDWSVFEKTFGEFYSEEQGRPAKPIRLLVGLHYLKHAFSESDESVVERLLENPYWQYFCGFEYFVHELPIDPTTLVKWRRRVGSEKMEKLLEETLDAAKRSGHLRKSDLERVNVDTTVQEKAIAFPTDSGLCHKMREKLVDAADERGINLRQSYRRVSKQALVKQSQYRRAGQHKRANRMARKIRTYLGRVARDIGRKAGEVDAKLSEMLAMAERLLLQTRDSKNKLYSLHAPEVECIAKGKSHKRYEFGCKVAVASTSKNNWIVGIKSFHGNPYDGHTLKETMEKIKSIAGLDPKHIYVDRGYRGHDYPERDRVHISGTGPRKKTLRERMWRRRRSAVEPVISHAKHDNRMIRNYLKGTIGDDINSVLAGCGFNIRKLLRAFFLPEIWEAFFGFFAGFFKPSPKMLLQLNRNYF